jgi:3-hydroxybutyryl-CoA dehydrogenase
MMNEIQNIAVVGAGLMGHGIAQDCARFGYSVLLHDSDPQTLSRSVERIGYNLRMLVAGGALTSSQADGVIPHIQLCPDLEEAVGNADFVIEAASEDLSVKQDLFRKLDSLCPARTILASSTSTFMPTILASVTQRRDRVIVAHYFNPPYLLPLVEVVCGVETSDQTLKTTVKLLKTMEKRPVCLRKEVPGFVGNRLQMALLREALSLVEQGIATPEDVDSVIKYGFGRRLAAAGIFEVFDFGGWNLILEIAKMLLPEMSSATDPSRTLEEKVARGELGVKSGKGFYDWTEESASLRRTEIAESLIALARKDAERPD